MLWADICRNLLCIQLIQIRTLKGVFCSNRIILLRLEVHLEI